jgi:cystathionine beta-lyase
MKYDFDRMVNRYGTDCYKWDMIIKRKLDPNTLPLWVADMDFETVPEVKERLKEVADRGIYGYSMLGDGYYDALKNWFSTRFNWQIENDWVIATPGVVFALAAAVRAYTKEGDSVMIQRPVYHPFTNVVKENGRKLVNNPLVLENGKYHMDYEDMEQKITEEQVKLFLLCSPHNPVSRVWTKEELCKTAEICKKHNVIMIVDEIHCDFVYEGYHHTSFGTLSEYADNAVICTAPSKTFNLAELQLSEEFLMLLQIQ